MKERKPFFQLVFFVCVFYFPKKSVFNLPNKSFTRKKGPVLQEKCTFFPNIFFYRIDFIFLYEKIFLRSFTDNKLFTRYFTFFGKL